MTDPRAAAGSLAGKRILVVEDQYLIASDLRRALEGAAAIVVGPAGTAERGLALVEEALDAAVLDVNLRGGTSLEIAERLAQRTIPYMFLTGKDGWALPEVVRDVPCVLKPYRANAVLDGLRRLIGGEGS